MVTASLELLKGTKPLPGLDPGFTSDQEDNPPETDKYTVPYSDPASMDFKGDAIIAPLESEVVDVDVMSVAQLDALVEKWEIGVPPYWWKKTDGVKKLTAPEKKAWLKAHYDEDSESAVNGAENSLDSALSSALESVPDEATTPQAIAAAEEVTAVPKSEKTEVVDSGEVYDLAHEIENLKESEAVHLAGSLVAQGELTYFRLGGVFSLIQGNKWYVPYASFREYVEREHGMHYRKAMYIISIYNDMTSANIPWSKVQHLGWTKMSILSPILTGDNVDEWITLAENKTAGNLAEFVKTAKKTEGKSPPLSDASAASVISSKTFQLHEDQKATVEAALAKACEESGTDVATVALEYMALDFLGSAKQSKSLKDLLIEAGLQKSLDALEAAFPGTNFTVEVAGAPVAAASG